MVDFFFSDQCYTLGILAVFRGGDGEVDDGSFRAEGINLGILTDATDNGGLVNYMQV